MEFVVDEEVLQSFVDMTDVTGEIPHKGIHHILLSMLQMGFMFRDTHQVILTNGDLEAGLDDDYNNYLDKRARGVPAEFNQ
jgi:hypothetical protein